MNVAIDFPLHVVGDQAPVGGVVDECSVCMNALERGVNMIVTCQHPAVVCVTCLTQMLALGDRDTSCPVCRGVVYADSLLPLPRVNRYINQLKRKEAKAQTEITRKDATIRTLNGQLRIRNQNRERDDRVIAEARAQLRHVREQQRVEQQQAEQARVLEMQENRARRHDNRAGLAPVVVNVRNVRRRFAVDLEDVWAPGGDDSTSESDVPDDESSSSIV